MITSIEMPEQPMTSPSPHQSAKNVFEHRLKRLRLLESDFEEHFSRSSGPGGQHVNKVSTAVTLRHRPTGISVTVQDSRSQAINRQIARERLLDAIEAAIQAQRAERRSAIEKVRRSNRKRPRGLKERILDSKKRRGGVKKMRGRVEE
jgi:protein subunit release factor B